MQAMAFAALVAAATSGSRAMLYAAGGLLALGNGFTQPTTAAFISKHAPDDRQGATLGTNQAFASLARTFGPAAGGWLYTAFGPRAPYGVASAGMLVALALAMGLRNTADQS
jgi:DHA1 family tetracycline resistance protein-like MFS transporter